MIFVCCTAAGYTPFQNLFRHRCWCQGGSESKIGYPVHLPIGTICTAPLDPDLRGIMRSSFLLFVYNNSTNINGKIIDE